MKALFLLAVLALSACRPSAASGPEPIARHTTVRASSPVEVQWNQVSLSASSAVVEAQVLRRTGLALPFSMRVEVPAGAQLVSGPPSWTLLPNIEAETSTTKLEFTFEAVPTADAILHLDGETGAMGFHAAVPYRFGRPAPAERAPVANGPSLMVGDRNLGPSIPLP